MAKNKKPNGDQEQLSLEQRVTTLQIRISHLEQEFIAVSGALAHLRTTLATLEKMRR